MRSVYEFDPEAADFGFVIGFDAMQQNVVEHFMLFEFAFGKRHRKARSINRQIEFLQKIRQRADVVFVSVRQYQRGQITAKFFQKIEIRYRNINAVRSFFGKAHSRVNDDHLIAVTDAHAVHPEFADAAKRYNFYSFHNLFLLPSNKKLKILNLRLYHSRTIFSFVLLFPPVSVKFRMTI